MEFFLLFCRLKKVDLYEQPRQPSVFSKTVTRHKINENRLVVLRHRFDDRKWFENKKNMRECWKYRKIVGTMKQTFISLKSHVFNSCYIFASSSFHLFYWVCPGALHVLVLRLARTKSSICDRKKIVSVRFYFCTQWKNENQCNRNRSQIAF